VKLKKDQAFLTSHSTKMDCKAFHSLESGNLKREEEEEIKAQRQGR
jgi:hypothetical protein